ncbi:DgyrCDS5022 [Dimorphilus gyrociliatus]|uniref:DgyrCDS5022 n=1 Tax=Dimorphilus gyrociliatus TaxID=2664684 RepID=A0A7I8VK57_9ANNE|nr:DgyrCDS5022 [Dimorphilus gyrociliatus]
MVDFSPVSVDRVLQWVENNPVNYTTATAVNNGVFLDIDLLLQLLASNSTTAIQNKVEQAMDMVKLHLMFTVKEEVQILQGQLQQLSDKHKKLQLENQRLRQVIDPQILANVLP